MAERDEISEVCREDQRAVEERSREGAKQPHMVQMNGSVSSFSSSFAEVCLVNF